MAFTNNQLKAIELRNRNILVSAAAGSGKTSVLVERIIRRITEDNSSIDIDRMLIMTFTKAAAKEMRDRIRQAIEEKIEADPNNDRLIRQSVLIHNAMITTIHGFCQSVIRDHFEELSIDPTFRVADENECKLIEMDALEEVLEEYYEEARQDFLDTVECFAEGKGDKKLSELIQKIYHFSQSNPNPKAYLDSLYLPYDVPSLEEFEKQDFIKDYLNQGIQKSVNVCELIEECVTLIDTNPGIEPYRKALNSDYEQIKKLTEANNYDEFTRLLGCISFEAFGRVTDSKLSEAEQEVKAEVSFVRKLYKAIISNMDKEFGYSLSDTYSYMKECKPYVKMLGELVDAFALRFSEKKLEKNIIDFNDMEHMAIKVLSDNKDVASSYRDQFEEIYIDEYQDSNMTQEALINCIRRISPNGNLFMVGDVKQSIYRFRQARPDLFVKKYDTYSIEESNNQKVILNDNFRSRKEVLDCVNEVFSVIMKKEYGGIEYDENAMLKLGSSYYEEADARFMEKEENKAFTECNYKAELVLCVKGELDKIELEAEYIAGRIKQMISSKMPVYDKKLGQLRPITYKDIVILTRSLTPAPVLKNVLENNGIPLLVSSSTGFFATTEVQTALAFLSVVDNPLSDIKLATYLMSPVCGFEETDLARLRTKVDEVDVKGEMLYESLQRCANSDREDFYGPELINKCQHVLERLEYYREKSCYLPVYGILNEFIDKEYGNYVRCMDRGLQRIANLEALVIKAEEYSKTSFKGLFNFVRYMNLMQKYEIEDGETNILGEENDVVRVMTIHKSKGLEFPVCFVFGMDRKRNNTDENGAVIWDTDYGIGVDRIDLAKRIKSKTLYKNYIKYHLKKENIAEEMRVLYVAMTRAREKLIMVGSVTKPEEFPKDTQNVLATQNYQDMMSIAYNNTNLFHTDIIYCSEEDIVKSRVEEELNRESIRDEFLELVRLDHDEFELPDNLKQIEFSYPQKLSYDLPSKLSVSELKHTDIERKKAEGSEVVEEGKNLFEDTNPERYIPSFMVEEGQTQSGATFYGTAFHRILELWDYSIESVTPENVTDFVEKMFRQNRFSQEQADAIREKDIAFFLNTDLGKRIYKANKEGLLFREQPFMIGMPAKEVAKCIGMEEVNGNGQDELVIVQGIIDAYIIENDEITIIDYKTDSVSDPQILLNRYTSQLEYYKKALEQITQKKVKELVIYSSKLRQEIKF